MNTESPSPCPCDPPQILLVDDDPGMLSVLSSFLSVNGFAVSTATGGRDALALVEREPLAAVVSDVRMAPMDGLELLARIHAFRPNLPVIMLTAYATRESANDALRLGAFAYLQKPFLNQELLASLRSAVAPPATP